MVKQTELGKLGKTSNYRSIDRALHCACLKIAAECVLAPSHETPRASTYSWPQSCVTSKTHK